MNSKLEKVENNVATLEISVSAEKLEEGIMKSYLKNVKKFNIAGFRKGKAPRKIIERHYGEAVFYEDAINIICPDAYDEAVKEHNLEPVDRPDIDIIDIESGKGLIFKAVVTVKPEVALGQYKGIEAEKKEYNVTDEEVDKEIEIMRDKNARLVEVSDRPVKNGDIIIIDFKGFVDDKQFEGGTSENFNLEVGSGQFIPGFEDQLVGAELGKEIDVNVQFPKEYNSEELAGKPALFKVTVKEIKEKQLVELDDEFAKDVSEFDTLDELKADIRKKKEEQCKRLEKQQYEDEVINKVVENATVDIPEVMVDAQVNIMLRDFDYQLRYQGLNLEAYLKYMNMDIDKLKESYRDVAKSRVKSQLVLEKVAEAEGIAATEEDLNAEIEKTAKHYNQDLEKFKKTLKEDEITYIKDGIVIQKAIDFLVDNSVAK
ncbi:MAG TPA: trigger factor [Bacillota bacterium]|nr:trigger factor [Bacillota bacterium]HRS21691.1 trigger factor [Clostridia bacterium]HQE65287.1 trigger factor [Bacillota bacterium]HQI15548.1 trigger factor [Bacillota bacterium]HQJ37236.1 trigger factor [Bacillota bacterium]